MADYKVNIPKSVVTFLHTKIKHTGKGINRTIPFTIASTRKKKKKEFLGISLTNYLKYLYNEYLKILKKEIEDTRR